MTLTNPKIFCALDTHNLNHAVMLAKAVKGLCGIKIGLTLFNRYGPSGVEIIASESGNDDIFLDLKYHDIPAQVAGSVQSATMIAPHYMTLHASGGAEMMRAAKDACPPTTKLLAVTVLTSLDSTNLENVGQDKNPSSQVARLAKLAQDSGMDGVVCSPLEINVIRETCGENFITMVPGIRPAGSDKGDQKRIMTPKEAIENGATHLVIGRPITQAENPRQAAMDILDSLT